jgi:hypothetical protein
VSCTAAYIPNLGNSFADGPILSSRTSRRTKKPKEDRNQHDQKTVQWRSDSQEARCRRFRYFFLKLSTPVLQFIVSDPRFGFVVISES